MRYKLFFAALIFVSWLKGELYALAQAQTSTWIETIGRSGTEYGQDIKQYPNGDYILVGYTQPEGAQDYDIYIARLSSNGDVIWQRTIRSQLIEYAYSLDITPDGGVIIGGTIQRTSNDFTFDILIIKLNAQGSIEWKKILDSGQNNADDYVTQVHTTQDGGYIVSSIVLSVGAGGYDISIIKLNANGEIEWQKTMGGTNTDYTWNIIQLPNGDYMLAGNSFEANLSAGTNITNNIVIAKIGQNGTLLSQKYIGSLNNNEAAGSIKLTSDNGYIISGELIGSNSNSDAYILRLDEYGNILWQKSVEGSGNEYAWDVVETNDQGFLLISETNSTGAGKYDIHLTKFSSDGSVQWQKTLGSTGNEFAKKILNTNDNGYILIGYTDSFGAGGQDIFIVKLNENGEVLDSNCNLFRSANLDVTTYNANYRNDIPLLQYQDSNLSEINIAHEVNEADFQHTVICKSSIGPSTVTVPLSPLAKFFIMLLLASSALTFIHKTNKTA